MPTLECTIPSSHLLLMFVKWGFRHSTQPLLMLPLGWKVPCWAPNTALWGTIKQFLNSVSTDAAPVGASTSSSFLLLPSGGHSTRLTVFIHQGGKGILRQPGTNSRIGKKKSVLASSSLSTVTIVRLESATLSYVLLPSKVPGIDTICFVSIVLLVEKELFFLDYFLPFGYRSPAFFHLASSNTMWREV